MNNLDEMIKHFGNQSNLARALNITRSAVSQWLIEDIVPPAKAIRIERLTDGKFKANNMVKK